MDSPKQVYVITDNPRGDGHQINDLMRSFFNKFMPELIKRGDVVVMPEELPDFIRQEDVDEAYGIMEWARHHIDEDDVEPRAFRSKMQKLKSLYDILEEAYDEGDEDYQDFVDSVKRAYEEMARYCH